MGRSLLAVLLLAVGAADAASPSFIPADDSTVLEHVGHPQRPAALAHRDLHVALALAEQAIRRGAEEGDPRYFGHAQSALASWWNLPEPPPSVRLLRATILQWLHQFDAARADLDAVITADGQGVMQAHLTRASVLLVQGDAAASRHDCTALMNHVETLIAATCIAAANSRLGHLDAARASLNMAISQSPTASSSARRWALTESAEMAVRLGQSDQADEAFRQALQLMQAEGSQDPYLLAAFSDHLLQTHRPRDVVPLLEGRERVDNLLLRLALAEDALASTDPTWRERASHHRDELAQRFAETRQRGDGIHQREEAWFLLALARQPAQALAVATDNWRNQRELTDAVLLVRCAQAAHQPAAAAPVREWVRATGVEDVRL